MTSRVTDRDGEQDVGSLPRHSPVLNRLTSPPSLFLTVQMMTLKLELHLQALIALIVSYLIGVGGGKEQCQGHGERGV